MSRSRRSASAFLKRFLRVLVHAFALHAYAMFPAVLPCVSDEWQTAERLTPRPSKALTSNDWSREDACSNIYLIGLGAIGAAYLAPLYDLQPSAVKVIVDPERRAALEEEPVHVNERAYRFRMISPGEACRPASLLLIAVKAGQLNEALASASAFIDRETVVLCLMNGLPRVMALSKYFNLNQILIGVVYTHATRTGHLVESRSQGKLILGAVSMTFPRTRMQSLKHLFRRAGIRCEVSNDIYRAAREKYLINVALNQVSGVLNATYGQLRSSPHARELLQEVAEELLEVARACGVALPDHAAESIINLLDQLPPEGKTSMLQDLEAGRKTEVDAFAGDVIRLGQEHGVRTPRNQLLFHMLRFLEKRRAASGNAGAERRINGQHSLQCLYSELESV